MTRARAIRAVTFDCWSTLIHEADPGVAHAIRLDALTRSAREFGHEPAADVVSEVLDRAWHIHWESWTLGTATGADEIAGWALEHFGIREPAAISSLSNRLSEAALEGEVRALEGARETLELLVAAGIRTALVCDTGLVRGTTVRRLLAAAALGDLLEVQIYSDEVGRPKPHRAPFDAALAGLEVDADEALHIGDLRRTDVAGARAVGMRTIRIRDHHDDRSEHLADADAVADSHADLRRMLVELLR